MANFYNFLNFELHTNVHEIWYLIYFEPKGIRSQIFRAVERAWSIHGKEISEKTLLSIFEKIVKVSIIPASNFNANFYNFLENVISNFLWFVKFVARHTFLQLLPNFEAKLSSFTKMFTKMWKKSNWFRSTKGILPNFQSSWKSMIDPR